MRNNKKIRNDLHDTLDTCTPHYVFDTELQIFAVLSIITCQLSHVTVAQVSIRHPLITNASRKFYDKS